MPVPALGKHMIIAVRAGGCQPRHTPVQRSTGYLGPFWRPPRDRPLGGVSGVGAWWCREGLCGHDRVTWSSARLVRRWRPRAPAPSQRQPASYRPQD